ncbi:MAG: nuclear transport factor 2 family protein [Rhodospirillaceae bacterium]|nr:nuclear transport factor 2 family protein [Rhodospirillaceae bacterium]
MAEQTDAIRKLVREAIAEAKGADAPPPSAAGQGVPVRIPVVIRDSADAGRLAQLAGAIAASPELGPRLKSGGIAFDARLEAGADGPAEAEGRAAFDRFFEAFNTGDFDRVWETVTDDFEWRLPGGPDAPYTSAKGKAAFRDAYTKRWDFLKHFAAINEVIFVSGDRVYQHYRVTGTGPDGKFYDFTGLDFYIVRGGKIALKDAYNKSVPPDGRSDAAKRAAPGGARAAAPSLDIADGVITERKVVEAARLGTRLAVGRRAVVTPLARDRARALGLTIERSDP